MGKKLVISEKPSVAMTIAKALGVNGKNNGYIEDDRYVISWCYGHLLENDTESMIPSDDGIWKLEELPIIPASWPMREIESGKKQLAILKKLMARKDVSSVVCATDAGREGELIFREVYQYAGCTKPCERLWVSSLEEDSIRKGFQELKPSKEYDSLYLSALARNRADWLMGINWTRFYSICYPIKDEDGKRHPNTIGRVQTPTLAMIVKRQDEIDNFKAEKRWAVVKDFGEWTLETEKFTSEPDAKKCISETEEKPVRVSSIESKKKQTKPPLLYSLTSLQQDANRIYGFTAQQTLSTLQGLYEKKISSYPRTDAVFITDDMAGTFSSVTKALAAKVYPDLHIASPGRVVNNAGVSDHYAVILTNHYARNMDKLAGELREDEKKIIRLIAARMMIAVSAPYQFEDTKVIGDCGGYSFSGIGRKEISPGWKAVERKLLGSKQKETNIFPADIAEGKEYLSEKTSMVNRDTKPPRPYTEDTLLGAMEKAGSEDLPEDAERRGIGTSATRAEIIEKLISVRYVKREKKQLLPTDKGRKIISIVSASLKSPKMTSDWEWRLKDIEKGKDACDRFCHDISENLSDIMREEVDRIPEEEKERLKKAAAARGEAKSGDPSKWLNTGTCPWCGNEVVTDGRIAKCTNRKCGAYMVTENNGYLVKAEAQRPSFTPDEVRALFSGKGVRVVLKSRKSGKSYRAKLSLDPKRNSKYNCYSLLSELEKSDAGESKE